MKKNILHLLSLLPLLALAAGCLELEQRVTIQSDGSGEIEFRYRVPEQSLPLLAAGQAQVQEWQGRATPPATPAPKLAWFLDEAATRAWFSATPLTLVSYATTSHDGQRLICILVRAADMRKALATGQAGDFTLLRTTAGDYRLSANLPEAETAPDHATPAPERLRELQAMTRGLKIRLRIQTPTPIVTTTAPNPSVMQAVWDFDPARQPELFSHPPKIDVTFSGKELAWDKTAVAPAPAPSPTLPPAAAPATAAPAVVPPGLSLSIPQPE